MPEAPAPGLPLRIETFQSRSPPSRSRWDLQPLWSCHQADGSLGPALDDPWGARHRPDWAARGLVIWPRGGQWRQLTLDLACPQDWRQLQAPAPVAQARLVLRWWADQVELRVNGQPVHAGDLFDTACRWLLPESWWQGEVLQLELRLRSPLHDDGALIESRLELEPLDPADPAALLAETKAELAQMRAGQPLAGGFHVLGHAHLDLAWLWPVADTWQAAERTFASALDLIERFEHLHFGHSTPALYAWLEQNRPALFARLQQAVAAGRFEPINGPWVETDCVLISGASLLRQFQLGQHDSAARFPGLEHPLAWLPDSFGFAAGLPAVAQSTGVRWFCTHKLFWNATNPFPHRLFRWRSRCGSEVLALMTAPIGTDGDPVAMERYRLAWQGASGVDQALWLPGVGDHGGGPTAEMLEQLQLWQQQPEAAPQHHGSLRAYLAALEPLAPRLPVWRDELYLELHRGCATSRPDQKRHNRTLERLLREADLAQALAGAQGALAEAEPADWRPLLFQQFHDILPGTSIPEVFEQAEPQWRAARRSACRQRDRALHTWLGGGADWWVAQLQPLPARARTLRMPLGAWSHGGIGLPAQAAWAGGQWLQLPALAGVEALPLERTAAGPTAPIPAAVVEAPVWVEGWRCGNGLVSFALGPGGLEQLWDGAGQPQLAGPLAWRRYADRGEFWDAWDIAANYRDHPLAWAWKGEPIWLEQGPLCTSFLWRGRCGASAVRLEGRLLANTPWLELVLSVDWRQRHELLRLEVPLAQPAQRWAADTSGGVLERPAQAVTAREQARWEVPAISWLASVAAGGEGLAVLLDGPQGVSACPEQLGISLLRAPTWPDPGADNGFQRLRLALLPCSSGWSPAQVPQQAVAFREPFWLRPAVAQGRPGRRQAFPPLGEGLLLLGCRPSGEGGAVVLTVQNCSPARRRLELGSAWHLLERLDGLDQPLLRTQASGGDPWLLMPWSLGFWRIRPARD
ncbi:alpha-mannosidase [Cyanobium sp. ATX 6E8]|uniref:alpha-mannosidase n=1 Tax=Cyanobium sp. ATX 6E8 TaxID=2823701 RepID=UPI0020CF2412|nr:glycoside hydrolase family 38 C-terminal domain-containing protein [Cyanobium sp. ATX 6E8]MCP9942232.1 alpha-mannosidase [Cyanobium sp. ATX 6E8]